MTTDTTMTRDMLREKIAHALGDDERLKKAYLSNADSILAAIHEAGLAIIETPQGDSRAPGWHIIVAAIRSADLARPTRDEG